jgi:hypothetical protein
MRHGSASIRLRLATEVFPGLLGDQDVAALQAEVDGLAAVRQLARKQKDSGAWGNNLLGVAPNKTTGIKDVGTIPQFRRLLELGVSRDHRALRVGSRLLFRLVSRDDDPKLLFEFEKFGHAEPGAEPWIRLILREAASAALAAAGHGDDPRVRGAAHKILNEVSAFLRSETASSPFMRVGRSWVLDPAAYPPTIFSVSLLSRLPAVQRERAGLVERLGSYLASPAPKKAFTVTAGKKSIKPTFLLLGDPLHVSASGQPDDLPFALYWMEVLARLGALHHSTTAARVWARLVKECDEGGVWHPKNVRMVPKGSSPWAYHYFPLELDGKTAESRLTDVTFRMALIARLAGWELGPW